MSRRKRNRKENREPETSGPERATVSLCMIVRNEEEFIGNCLKSVKDVVDEIIVVDTGSSDTTPGIAAAFGARVLPFEWIDDFSEARNYSLAQATGNWILVLDADEMIADCDVEKIRELAEGDADGYLFTYRSYSRDTNDIRWVTNDGSYSEGNGWDGWISGKVVRMFRRDPRTCFHGAVHESVDPSIRSFGGSIAPTDIIIHHFHEKKGSTTIREKQLSYLRLCEKRLEQFPTDPKTYFDMGLIYKYVLDDVPKAISHQKRAIQLDPDYIDARMALAFLYHFAGDDRGAADELTTILKKDQTHAPALMLCGIILERRGKIDRAIECYERVLRLNPSLVEARVNLGTQWLKKGDSVRARNEWEHVLRMNPSNARALLNLGALELRDGNYDSAQRFLEKALKQTPENPALWNNLGVLHANAGRTQQACNAFERSVKLNPSCQDSRRNLETIRARMYSTV